MTARWDGRTVKTVNCNGNGNGRYCTCNSRVSFKKKWNTPRGRNTRTENGTGTNLVAASPGGKTEPKYYDYVRTAHTCESGGKD